MELNIVNPDAEKAYEALGISEERANELSDSMTRIMRELIVNSPTVRLSHIYQVVASLCLTTEELVFAIDLNTRWFLKVERGLMNYIR